APSARSTWLRPRKRRHPLPSATRRAPLPPSRAIVPQVDRERGAARLPTAAGALLLLAGRRWWRPLRATVAAPVPAVAALARGRGPRAALLLLRAGSLAAVRGAAAPAALRNEAPRPARA